MLTKDFQVVLSSYYTKVKPKIWTAHVNGKKHKDACKLLKQQLICGVKRPNDVTCNENEAPSKKRIKDTDTNAPSSNASLPSDFFDEEPSLNIQTPWQKSKEGNTFFRERKGIIEGVPQGFFDDRRRDGMVRETIENEAHMNEEYDRLMRELNEKHVEEEAKADEEDERDARLRDIANADEQMEKWMLLNAMEKMKESKLQKAREKASVEKIEDEGSEEDDVDFTNWRAKQFL
ncbi:hypothetical protein DICVIV_10131 [Dictyocaulus viviparus]|uniref:ZNF380 coiled-coil domain-containing protein n=1 Tax=Dictyocaulus viviparus TaxID=29172 RepID=A0A0D8XGR0_DICVI|nr:hypothetical protein DICVIV_10131 [Dictyocaulus viviparus]